MENLPDELIWMIACRLPTPRDLKRLCETSKRIYNITAPRLYESVIICVPELSLEDTVSRLEHFPLKHLKYTKDIWFKAQIQKRLKRRCLHYEAPELQGLDLWSSYHVAERRAVQDRAETKPFDPFSRLMHRLDVLFGSLKPDNLRSFRWDLGTCLPRTTLGSSSKIWEKQRRIKDISLVTDPCCGVNPSTQFFVDLSLLEQVSSISWKGLYRYQDLEALRECFCNNSKSIKSLTINLSSWEDATNSLETATGRGPLRHDFFANRIFGIESEQEVLKFPELADLSLSWVSFHSAAREMAYALNMYNLSSLKLWNCPSYPDLLDAMRLSGRPVRLRSLELSMGSAFFSSWNPRRTNGLASIIKFLLHFQGLEDLFIAQYVHMYVQGGWYGVLEGIANHKVTLQRLVINEIEDTEQLLELPIDERAGMVTRAQDLFEGTQLSCLGVSFADNSQLVSESVWKCLSQCQSSCSFLHVKFPKPGYYGGEKGTDALSSIVVAGKEHKLAPSSLKYISRRSNRAKIIEFAKKAFRASGIPSLQVIAYGDFSHDGRFANWNLLLCRDRRDNNSPQAIGVKALTEADTEAWKLLVQNYDMLTACPYGPLTEPPGEAQI